jgi:hypothetical protein
MFACFALPVARSDFAPGVGFRLILAALAQRNGAAPTHSTPGRLVDQLDKPSRRTTGLTSTAPEKVFADSTTCDTRGSSGAKLARVLYGSTFAAARAEAATIETGRAS